MDETLLASLGLNHEAPLQENEAQSLLDSLGPCSSLTQPLVRSSDPTLAVRKKLVFFKSLHDVLPGNDSRQQQDC